MEKNIDKKERVILIKGDSSKWYEQAIFIVNQNTPKSQIPVDFVAEAEKIIQNHIRKSYGSQSGSEKSKNVNKNSRNVGIAYTSVPANNDMSNMRTGMTKAKKSRKRFDYILNTIMVIGSITIVAFLAWGLLG